MIAETIDRLIYLCEFIPPLLLKIDRVQFSEKPSAKKWSRKEILGHLIDSATNNHQRFVRVQFENEPSIWYKQDQWVEFSYHQQIDTNQLISFWETYNRYLAVLLRTIPLEMLQRRCVMKDGSVVTLEFLVNDYVTHLEHHLRQIVEY
ncbi:DinB family protein [Pollutibacter soli]|uniref:DinB family protein n=1 Tax=Pollutibacter soli TaxID=3034157 RepID=UPI003013C788